MLGCFSREIDFYLTTSPSPFPPFQITWIGCGETWWLDPNIFWRILEQFEYWSKQKVRRRSGTPAPFPPLPFGYAAVSSGQAIYLKCHGLSTKRFPNNHKTMTNDHHLIYLCIKIASLKPCTTEQCFLSCIFSRVDDKQLFLDGYTREQFSW